MTVRHSRTLVLFAAVLVLATGCDEPKPIEVGFVGGHPIQLITEDDRQDPETARAGFGALAARPVEAVIGPMTSALAVALAPLADRHNIALLSPTVTTRDLAAPAAEGVFTAQFVDRESDQQPYVAFRRLFLERRTAGPHPYRPLRRQLAPHLHHRGPRREICADRLTHPSCLGYTMPAMA